MDLNDRENIVPYIRGARDVGDPPNIVHLLNNRQLGLTRRRFPTDFKQFAELKASRSQLQETHCDLPASARSTFLMSFSHDCTKIASTHGDHNIYVSEMKTGKPIKTLEGHPRTPWCIAFHPTSNDILASGCLAGEVRVWDLRGGGSERWRADHDQVIASLAFHPTDQLLVIATGNSLYFWNWNNPAPDGHCSTNSDLERVRYVKFDPLGFRIITGIANLNNCCGLHTNTCGLTSTSFRTHPTYLRQNPHDVDMYRACRRSIMERLISLPERETLRRQPCNSTACSRTDRNVSSSSSSSSSSSFTKVKSRVDTSSSDNKAGTSGETNQSRLSGGDNESRPHRDIRPSVVSGSGRSPAIVRRRGPLTDLTESFCENLTGLVDGMVEDVTTPLIFDNLRNRSTEPQQTVRTPPEDDLDTSSSVSSSVPAERCQSQPYLLDHRGNLHSRNNVETSTDHQNNSLSDHDYFSESNMSQSQVNNESFNHSEPSLNARKIKEKSDRLKHTFQRIQGLCNDLEQKFSRTFEKIEAYEPRAGPSQNNRGRRAVQSNETFEPRAGPSQNNGGRRVLQSKETSEPRAGPSQSNRGRRVLQSNETSEPRVGPSQNDGGSGVLHSNETFEPRAGSSQSNGGRRVLQSNETFEPKAGLPQNYGGSQIRNSAELASRSEDGDDEHTNPRVETMNLSDANLAMHTISNENMAASQECHRTVWNTVWNSVTKPVHRVLTELETFDPNTSLSQISAAVQLSPQPSVTTQNLSSLTSSVPEEMPADSFNSTEQSAEMRNTLRNPLIALRDNVERPTVNENKADMISGSSPSRVHLPRHRYNPLHYVKRSKSSSLESNREISRSKNEKRKQFDEIARGSLENGPSTSQTSGSFRSPVIPHLSSLELSIDMPSSPVTNPIYSSPATMAISSSLVTAEASSASINTEDSITFTRNSPQPRTIDLISGITNENLPAVSKEAIGNHEIDRFRAEASTQASSPSDSRNYLQLAITIEDMSDDDDDIFTSVLSKYQCSADVCIATAGPSTSLTPTEPYRELHVEDITESDMEFEIPQTQSPIASNPIQIENRSDSDLELENPQTQGPIASSPSTSDLDLLNESGSGAGSSRRLSSYFDAIIEPISDASSDDSDRPSTPPLLMYSQSYNSLLFTGNSRIALNDPLTQNHRIQVWDFTSGEFPPIYDATANIVVRRCMIHNDASVDISQDGEKLVALIPPEERELINNLMFGVFSLRPGHLGRTLCIWGYISNAISVSFSPLAQYVVVGSAYSRPIYSNPEKAAVAQIIKINKSRDSYDASYIRSFTQVINNDNTFQQVSLNCVRWLPMSGLGIAYATNRGCLCICKPIAGEMFENVPNEANSEGDRITQRIIHQIRAIYRPRP